MLIHLYFMFLYSSHKVPHYDLTVEISLFSSIVAICISLFNVIASAPNEFDPRLLEIELRRKRTLKEEIENPESSPKSGRRKKSINLEPGHFSMIRGAPAGLNFAEAINQMSPDLRS